MKAEGGGEAGGRGGGGEAGGRGGGRADGEACLLSFQRLPRGSGGRANEVLAGQRRSSGRPLGGSN